MKLPFDQFCEILKKYQFIGNVYEDIKRTKFVSVASFFGCRMMIRDVRQQLESKWADCKTRNYPSKCLLDTRITDWNFMPFLMKPPDSDGQQLCVTLITTPSTSTSTHTQRQSDPYLPLQPCVIEDVDKDWGLKYHYTETQFFHLYPLSATPQLISVSEANENILCLVVRRVNGSDLAVTAAACDQSNQAQMFRPELISDSRSLLRMNRSQIVASSSSYLRPTSRVKLHWRGEESGVERSAKNDWCLGIVSFKSGTGQDRLGLVPCSSSAGSSLLSLQRTSVYGPQQP